ncbi:sensor histidine kinase [Thermomonospora cellulosilytica]|uniref:histidine kinase n=1 Tax=Thermomonospora cellulosilytica TaxID=1411118 RepID=A0A7W3RAL0_9ACTN|nr:ATP-binding protein [Thermomonospora cellulosilytica]MBA9005804.1 signal transduction histidine kinase [Thermomonospora cellulosilytica]
MAWKHLPLRVSSALTAAAFTAAEAVGLSLLFLRSMGRERALPSRRRARPATCGPVFTVPEPHRPRSGRGPVLVCAVASRVPWYGSARLVIAATTVSAAATAVAFAMAYRDTGRVLTPMDQIRREFAEITATDLSRRIPVPDHPELRDMVGAMNAALDRLEIAFDDLQRFTSDASHDLRSPLAGIRTRLEEALAHPGDVDWPRTAADVLAGVDRQQAIVTDLLSLARLDTGGPIRLQRTDLTRLTGAELRARPAGRIPIASDLGEAVTVDCDPLLITRLLTNLLDNAQRHAATQVTVAVTADEGAAVLRVIDDGDGIPPEQREKVFERFTRLQASRDRDPGGTGLGLPISRLIAEAHNGTLTIEAHDDPHPVTCFVLRLPLYGG